MRIRKRNAGKIDLPADLIEELEGMEYRPQGRPDAWTESEQAIIREYYPKLGGKALAKFFADHRDEIGSPRPRSVGSIQSQASILGVSFSGWNRRATT